ncbi:MAG: ribonuclease Y [Kiritimatiellae bacterium]|nr:ribonuclease Y [Kiritimatiellia bacterium]
MLFALTSSTWDGLSDGVAILIIAALLLVGLFLGYALRGLVGRWQAESIEKRMKLREEESEAEIKARQKEAAISARAVVVRAKEEFEASTKKRRAELQAIEDRQTQREANLDRKAAALDARETAVAAKAEAADTAARDATAKNAAADARLQELAKMTHADARREILVQANAELRADAAILSRRIQEAAREQGEAIAARIVADAVQRCAVSHVNELTTSAVTLPGAEMKGRIVGRDGRNVRAFESATGVQLLLDDAPDSVVLSSFDPMRREIARRALEALVADGRIQPSTIENAVAAARASVARTTEERGAEAAAEAGVPGLPVEILRLVGALGFRLSFSQNVLRHSVEVALLSGAMAAEMKLDAALARRVGFLHDIGKAITAEKRGAHAALGAEFLLAHGEDPKVCAAVAAHHADAGTDGGVYGVICAAADAISSARPGARQENVGDYIQRLENLEKIAKSHAGVQHVFAVQAGRDLRVVVDPAVVADNAASELAGEICRDISAQLKFPGMIRVTVIRELRCVEYAK